MRVLFAAGGTGGHINPAIAIAREFRAHDKNCEIMFVGTKRGLESKLVPLEGFDIEYIEAVGFKRKLTPENIVVAYKAFTSMLRTHKIIKNFRPDLVIGCGGYTSGPVVMAAALKKIPTLIHEQNVFPGVSNKMLSPKVDTVCISFEDARKYFTKAKNIVFTGNPVRPKLFTLSKKEAREKLGIDERPLIVAVGGSLGAGTINQEMLELVKNIGGNVQVLWATGAREFDEIKEKAGILPENIKLSPYIYNMEEVLAAADLAISRSGAITITELCATATPSILIPSPNVAENHQEINARSLESRGAATVICERELKPGLIYNKVNEFVNNPHLLSEMSENAYKLANPDACTHIYKECIKLLNK